MRLGSDPEVFLVNKQGQFKSSIGLIKADKWNPFQIPELPKGYTLQEDNVLLEFGIPPAKDADEFVAHIDTVLKAGLSKLPGLSYSNLSCTIMPETEMDNPMAFIFGCEPDFNAWTGRENKKPNPPHKFMRSAGGHIHVETKVNPRDGVRACDLFLAVPSVLMDKNGTERRKLYGKPGAFRYKPYGFEYRTLSNFWIFNETYIRWAWRNTARAVEMCEDPSFQNLLQKNGKVIRQTILEGDRKTAEFLVNQFSLEVV